MQLHAFVLAACVGVAAPQTTSVLHRPWPRLETSGAAPKKTTTPTTRAVVVPRKPPPRTTTTTKVAPIVKKAAPPRRPPTRSSLLKTRTTPAVVRTTTRTHAHVTKQAWEQPGVTLVDGPRPRRPLHFMHVPKTGSTIENILFRAWCRWSPAKAFTEPFKSAKCPTAFSFWVSGHVPIVAATKFDPRRVAYVTVLRRPWARVESGLYHNLHDAEHLQKAFAIQRENVFTPYTAKVLATQLTNQSVLDYKRTVEGCAGRLLTGRCCGDVMGSCFTRTVPRTAVVTEDYDDFVLGGDAYFNATLALERLADFAFVGITEHWGATLALISAKFDVPIVDDVDRPVHRLHAYPESPWVADVLRGEAYADDSVYAAGLRRFADEARRLRGALLRLEESSTSDDDDDEWPGLGRLSSDNSTLRARLDDLAISSDTPGRRRRTRRRRRRR